MANELFRKQALKDHQQRLYGDALLLPQKSHRLILGFITLWFLVVSVWLIASNYSRNETVSGWLEPPEGIVKVYFEVTGTI